MRIPQRLESRDSEDSEADRDLPSVSCWSLDSGPLVCAASTLSTGSFPKFDMTMCRNYQTQVELCRKHRLVGAGRRGLGINVSMTSVPALRTVAVTKRPWVWIFRSIGLCSLNGWITWYLNCILNYYKKNSLILRKSVCKMLSTCVHMCLFKQHVCMCICMCMYVCACVPVCMCVHACAFVYVCAYAHEYRHAFICIVCIC